MSIRDIVAAAYRYSWPRLGHYRDPVWIIQYSTNRDHFRMQYSTLEYIQSFLVSTSSENAGMTRVKRGEEIWINET